MKKLFLFVLVIVAFASCEFDEPKCPNQYNTNTREYVVVENGWRYVIRETTTTTKDTTIVTTDTIKSDKL